MIYSRLNGYAFKRLAKPEQPKTRFPFLQKSELHNKSHSTSPLLILANYSPNVNCNVYILQFSIRGNVSNSPVKPVPLVNPLPQYLYRGLGPVLLLGWHVKVINKLHQLFPWVGPIHTLLCPKENAEVEIND